MRRTVFIAATICILCSAGLLAVDSRKAQYIGGTLTQVADKAEGPVDIKQEAAFVFAPEHGTPLSIPYGSVAALEYGQKAGRSVTQALLISPLTLFHKKRHHYLTITFHDEAGKEQAAVFELGKNITRTTLAGLEVRTGKKVEYQDEEARKAGR